MSLVELNNKYMRLRADLESAYGEPVWNSPHIDSLTDAIADTELALSAAGGDTNFLALHRSVLSGTGTTVAHF